MCFVTKISTTSITKSINSVLNIEKINAFLHEIYNGQCSGVVRFLTTDNTVPFLSGEKLFAYVNIISRRYTNLLLCSCRRVIMIFVQHLAAGVQEACTRDSAADARWLFVLGICTHFTLTVAMVHI